VITGLQPVVPRSVSADIVVDRDPASANHLKGILPDDKGRLVVNTNPGGGCASTTFTNSASRFADVRCGLMATLVMNPKPVVWPGAIKEVCQVALARETNPE
jgi:hypothetical protein